MTYYHITLIIVLREDFLFLTFQFLFFSVTEAGVVLNLFLNFEKKSTLCSR